MSVEYLDIAKDLTNGENMGGISMKVFFAKWADVLTWPTKPTGSEQGATLETMGKLTGNIAMKVGKKFQELYITDDEGELKFDPVGPKDGKSFIMRLTGFNPGLKAKLLGLINLAKNDDLVFIVPDNNGQMFLMGDALRAATFESSPDGAGTGKETAGKRGISFEFVFKTANLYEYTGTVPLTPAE